MYNNAGYAGGLFAGYKAEGIIENNVITDNVAATYNASAIYIGGSKNIPANALLFVHNIIASNRGGDGSAIYVRLGNCQFKNNIIANHPIGIIRDALYNPTV